MRRLATLTAVLALATGGPAWPQPRLSRERLVAQMARWTRLPRSAVVSVEPGLVVALVSHPAGESASGELQGVELQGEVSDEAEVAAHGWRSMRVRLDISCRTLSDRVQRMTVYTGHDAHGQATPITPPAWWILPTRRTYAADAMEALCPKPAAPASAILAAPSPAPSPAPPPLPAPTAASAAPPSETSPWRRPAPATAAATPAPKAAQAPAEVSHVRVGAVSRRPATRSNATVHLASALTQATAEHALDVFLASHPATNATLRRRIEPAAVQGRTVYRVMLTGFGRLEDAEALCARLQRAGGACVVRAGR